MLDVQAQVTALGDKAPAGVVEGLQKKIDAEMQAQAAAVRRLARLPSAPSLEDDDEDEARGLLRSPDDADEARASPPAAEVAVPILEAATSWIQVPDIVLQR